MATTTPNMGLTVPQSQDTDYPTSVSDSLDAIDEHDHTTGSGVQIPTDGIENLAVTSAKLAGSIPQSKLTAKTLNYSGASGTYTTSTNDNYEHVSALDVTLTPESRPLVLMLVGDGSGNPYVQCSNGAALMADVSIEFRANGTPVDSMGMASGSVNDAIDPILVLPPSAFRCIHASPGSSSVTYSVHISAGGTSLGVINDVKLLVYPL